MTARIDDARAFIPVRIAILTVSDTRTPSDDVSGDTLARFVTEAGHELAARALVTDDAAGIRRRVEQWIDDPGIDVIVTTGGTGFTGRDVTPEAIAPLFE
jgi:molybdenum cofactor biosynthesis protein B